MAQPLLSEVPADTGPYEPQRLIATGSQAEVWLASGPDGEVALKVATSDKGKAQLAREVEVHRRVQHTNLVSLLDHAPDHSWIALEQIDGDPIDLWCDGEELVDIIRVHLQLARALAALHGAEVVHGDLKPSNVLVDALGTVKLLDFGVATLPDDEVKGFKGTLGWAAPEMLRGERPSAGTDIYGLGALLYAAITGRPPFEVADPAALTYLPLVSLPAPPNSFRPDLPSALNKSILALLTRNPARRPKDLERIESTLAKVHRGAAAPPVLGMANEREELRRAVVGACDSETRVVIVYGPPGSGRRTLIQEAVDSARREGLPYLKGSDPRKILAALRKQQRPVVCVLRDSNTTRKLCKVILRDWIPCLMLVHADRPVPALAQSGAIQLTPAPLGNKDATRLARLMGADPTEADTWWRASLGLPIAVIGHIRAAQRLEAGDLDGSTAAKDLPNESLKILNALEGSGAVPLPVLAEAMGMSEHTLLDHCEVLFAEGLVMADEGGAAIRSTIGAY